MMNLSFEEMYNAIGKKESFYEGAFITAVKSTKIFCRPSCRARKPLAKNVTFYANAEEALKHGYRPCKICRPMEPENETPLPIQQLIKDIHLRPFEKISDFNLRQKGIEPSQVRRWFKKNHNMTFHAYQRLIRINSGYHQIQQGERVTDSAFDSGYESLSGFIDGFKAIFGQSPKNLKGKKVIRLERFTTKLGPMFAGATDRGLCLLEFTDRRMLPNEIEDLRKRLNAVVIPGKNKHIDKAIEEVRSYFMGDLQKFSVALDTPGTEFQNRVWSQLQTIPYGATRSYREQALALNQPKAVRAVARANGMNRIAIIIPCHRVIGSDGSLVGYAGGIARKKWLLEHESSLVSGKKA